jgi:hypothetical protein
MPVWTLQGALRIEQRGGKKRDTSAWQSSCGNLGFKGENRANVRWKDNAFFQESPLRDLAKISDTIRSRKIKDFYETTYWLVVSMA